MQTPTSEPSLTQAQQVCTSCKTRKRKCNKALPTCSSCSKRNLTCEYLTPGQSRDPASDSSHSWHGFPVENVQVEDQSIDFPTMLFLDPGLLRNGQIDVSPVTIPAPAHILHLLGGIDEIRATASKFFEHMHIWMPFISKKRFYDLYLRPSFPSRPDLVLLFLSLRLITTFPPTSPRNPRTSLYHTSKHFYLEVEGSSNLSMPVLQAGVLIALYELGHGIYPAAFLSIGACARYAHALGIKVSKNLKTTRVLTLVEVEERRRVWWAIVILDRYVSIGCPGRPLATADPGLDDFLPANDAAWDQGIVRSDDSYKMSSPMTGHMSKFALLCQAARLLGQVLHVSSDSATHDNVWMQLERTIQSMLAASLDVESPDHDQISFVYSTLVALYTPWLSSYSSSRVDPERSQHARTVLEQITEKMSANLVEQHCFLGRNPEDMPPWGLFFSYHVCRMYMCRSEQESAISPEVIKSVREVFQNIDVRWNVAGIYLQLLEAQEAMHQY